MITWLISIVGALVVDAARAQTPSRFGGALKDKMPPEWPELWLKLGRSLAPDELEAAREAFGDQIPYDLLRLVDYDFDHAGQALSRMEGEYFLVRLDESGFQRGSDAQDWSTRQPLKLRVLVHELAHVWQMAKHGGGSKQREAYLLQQYARIKDLYPETWNLYRYSWKRRLRSGVPWEDWGHEAQADFITAVWALLRDHPDAVLEKAYAPYLAHLPVQRVRLGETSSEPSWQISSFEELKRPPPKRLFPGSFGLL